MKIKRDMLDSKYQDITSPTKLLNGKFELNIHEFPEGSGKKHYDIRIYTDTEHFDEIGLINNPIENENIPAIFRSNRDIPEVSQSIQILDKGDITYIKEEPSLLFISGETLRGFYMLRKGENLWEFVKYKSEETQELTEDDFSMWVTIKKLDVPGREIHADILTPKGREGIILGVFNDDIIQDLLERIKTGDKTILVRIFRGFIIQIMNTTMEKEGQLDNA